MEYYDVRYNGDCVGKVSIQRDGLYARITCTCQFLNDDFYRLLLGCGDKWMDLGLLVRTKSGFGICTQIPIKKINFDTVVFKVSNAAYKNNQKYVTIDPTIPFVYFEDIDNLRVQLKDNKLWFVLPG